MNCPIHGIDIVSGEHKRDPFPLYARLRDETPVARFSVSGFDNAWLLTRRQDVISCLVDQQRFRRNPEGIIAADAAPLDRLVVPPHPAIGRNMLDLDGAGHRRLRSLLAKWFTQDAIEKWRLQAAQIAETLLDDMEERTEVDLVADYARPLPLAIIGSLYGVPVETRREREAWAQIVESRRDLPGRLAVVDPESPFNKWVTELYRARRAEPVDDMAGTLACGADGADPLSEVEFVAMADFLLFGGHETTANLIASGVLALLESAIPLSDLVDDPGLLRDAVEELLRFCAPVDIGLARFVSKDTVLGDARLRRGDVVFPVIASANRDEAEFQEPDRLDIRRAPNHHIAFGAGPHHCIGLHLARMEAGVAFTALFRRYPRLSLARSSASLTWRSVNIVRGLEALPIRLRQV